MLKVLEKGRILLVSDPNKTQKTVIRALESDGYDVYTAETEDQALFQLYDEEPDLIVVDLKMRSSEGIRTFEKVMKHDKWKRTPVLVLSEDSEIIKYLEDYNTTLIESVCEPVKPLILRHRVELLLDRKKLQEDLAACQSRFDSQTQIISEAETTIRSQQSEIDKLEKEVDHVGVKDYLTGLYNRKASLTRLEEEIARHDRNGLIFSVLLCDIDNLTDKNLKYGRVSGDVVIKKVSELITEGKRQQDFAARWHGGEFFIILPDTDLEGAVIFADRARERVAKHVFKAEDGKFNVTITSGVLCYDKPIPPDITVQLIDKALKNGKTKGRNVVVPADVK